MTRLLSSLRDNWSHFGECYSWKGRLFLVCASAFRCTFFHPDVFSASSGPHIQSACPQSIHTTSEQSRYFPHFSPWVAAFWVRHRRPSQTWFDSCPLTNISPPYWSDTPPTLVAWFSCRALWVCIQPNFPSTWCHFTLAAWAVRGKGKRRKKKKTQQKQN